MSDSCSSTVTDDSSSNVAGHKDAAADEPQKGDAELKQRKKRKRALTRRISDIPASSPTVEVASSPSSHDTTRLGVAARLPFLLSAAVFKEVQAFVTAYCDDAVRALFNAQFENVDRDDPATMVASPEY